MSHYEFTNLFINDLSNILILVFYLVLYISLFRKDIFSIFDPLVVTLIPLIMTMTIVTVLLFNNFIEFNVFFKILLGQFFLVVGYKIIKKEKEKKHYLNLEEFKIFYILHTVLFIIFFILYCSQIGFLLSKNQLLMYSQNILTKIIQFGIYVLFPGQLILLKMRRNLKKKKKIDYIYFIMIFLIFFSSGKVGVVNFFSILITTSYIFSNELKGVYRNFFLKEKKREKYILIIVLLALILAFSLNSNIKELSLVLEKILIRMLAFGDIYFMILPQDKFVLIEKSSFLKYYFWWILGPISLLLRLEIQRPITIGFEAMKIVYNMENPIWGPNTRFDILYLIFNFKIYQIILVSFFLGAFLSFTRKKELFKSLIFRIYIRVQLIFIVGNILTDMSIFVAFFLPLIVIFPTLVLTTYFIIKLRSNK